MEDTVGPKMHQGMADLSSCKLKCSQEELDRGCLRNPAITFTVRPSLAMQPLEEQCVSKEEYHGQGRWSSLGSQLNTHPFHYAVLKIL